MNMKKKVCITMMSLIVFVLFTACNSSVENKLDNTNETEVKTDDADEQVSDSDNIIWTIPNYGIELNTELLNKTLQADGYPYQLTVNCISDTEDADYQTLVSELLSQGKTDIAFLGTAAIGEVGDDIARMVREGILLELSDYLNTEQGKVLKNAFYEGLWDTVKVDNRLCIIPNQVAEDGTSFFAFNKEIFTEADLEDFDGTPQSLKDLLDQKDTGELPIIWDIGINQLAFAAGQEYRYGVLFDLQTGAVSSLYESEPFLNAVNAVRFLRQENYFGEDAEFYEMYSLGSEEKHDAMIKGLDFSVWAGQDYTALREDIQEKTIIVQMPYALFSRVSAGTGVSSRAPHKEKALEFLTLLYTNEKYSNLLIWGEENIDYTLENGIAEPISQLAAGAFVKEFLLGVYDIVLPAEGDSFITDRAAAKRSLYESEARCDSIVTGFQADLLNFDSSMKGLESIADNALKTYISGESTFEDFETVLLEAGTEKVKEELQRQVTEWLN